MDLKKASRKARHWAQYNGLLEPGKCAVCGSTENVEAHHEDYSKPFEITWLCREHHREHHTASRLENYHGPKPIHDLLRVGVSRKAIAEHLKLDPWIVGIVTASWRRHLLPKLLRARFAVRHSGAQSVGTEQ